MSEITAVNSSFKYKKSLPVSRRLVRVEGGVLLCQNTLSSASLKLMVVGDGGVGKSCFITQFVVSFNMQSLLARSVCLPWINACQSCKPEILRVREDPVLEERLARETNIDCAYHSCVHTLFSPTLSLTRVESLVCVLENLHNCFLHYVTEKHECLLASLALPLCCLPVASRKVSVNPDVGMAWMYCKQYIQRT